MRLIAVIFCFLFSFSLIAEDLDSKQEYIIDEDATFRESSDELIIREITIDPKTHPGNLLYQENCATCHDGSIEKAPAANWLEMLIPQALLRTINEGIMSEQAAHLSNEERIQIVEYIVRQDRKDFPKEAELNYCDSSNMNFNLKEAPEPYGWGYNTSRFIPKESGGIDSKNIKNLKLKWAFGFPYSQRARSQPLFAMGSIFVGSQSGDVYALDVNTGCVKWNFSASGEVRTGIIMDSWENGWSSMVH